MAIQIRLLRLGDEHILEHVAEDVFDAPPVPELTRAFLADSSYHIVVAMNAGIVAGMATAFDYMHPDKPARGLYAAAGGKEAPLVMYAFDLNDADRSL